MRMRDAFCSFCGAAFAAPLTYPRTCASCGVTIWANPIPVVVALVPIAVEDRLGLLTVRRAIPPGIGKLALVGGFLEAHETWQHGGAREVREETGVAIDPAALAPFWFTSTAPRPDRVLLFALAAPVTEALPPLVENHEVSERGVIVGPDGLDEIFAFELHAAAARRYFAERGITGAHGFRAL
ncbi:MAG: NUDIX domain-containing protein [Deltaproteobacteria bacterium]|nr:NUDIX domain-containing protein [Deltaproteobacteria bacterium]